MNNKYKHFLEDIDISYDCYDNSTAEDIMEECLIEDLGLMNVNGVLVDLDDPYQVGLFLGGDEYDYNCDDCLF